MLPIKFLIKRQPSAYWMSKTYVAVYLVFNKFLAVLRSFILKQILAGSFLNENTHVDHLDFNTFLVDTFLNANMHAGHLVFL